MTDKIETEIKFKIESFARIKNILDSISPSFSKHLPRIFESNILLDNESEDIKRSKQVLRLRQEGSKHILTFKFPKDPDQPGKSRREIETEINDSQSILIILEALGYKNTLTYEKYRETYLTDSLNICLDELPFGLFVELEGPWEKIVKWADTLELDLKKSLNLSYIELGSLEAAQKGVDLQQVLAFS